MGSIILNNAKISKNSIVGAGALVTQGKEFEEGKLSLEDMVAYAKEQGEPKQASGKQELYETILSWYCK